MNKIVTKNIDKNSKEFNLGVNFSNLDDFKSTNNKIDTGFLAAKSETKYYFDLDFASTEINGYQYNPNDHGVETTHKLQLANRLILGNYSELDGNGAYKYTAGMDGFYLIHVNITILVSDAEMANDYWDGNPIILYLYKNNANHVPYVAFPTSVYDYTDAEYYPTEVYQLSGSWGLYLNKGDYIEYLLNLFGAVTIRTLNFTIRATSTIHFYTNQNNTGIVV